MQTIFEKMTKETLRKRIAAKIQEAILNGSLAEGQRLVERHLSYQFHTSLTVVREALIELESEGFVSKTPNSATYVTNLSLDSAANLFAVRRVLEALAVEEAVRLANPEQILAMERCYSEMLEAARASEARAYVKADLSFHESIWGITNNEYLHAAIRRAALPLFAFTAIRVASEHGFDLAKDAYSHLPLLEALKSKDTTAVRQIYCAASDRWLSDICASVIGGRSDV